MYLALLGATLLIEVPLAAGLAGAGKRSEVSAATIVLNLCTHPAATAVICLAGAPWLPIEIAVAAAEGIGLCALTSLGRTRSVLLALTVNALSAWVGALLAAA